MVLVTTLLILPPFPFPSLNTRMVTCCSPAVAYVCATEAPVASTTPEPKSHSTVATLFGGDSMAWNDTGCPTVGAAGETVKSAFGGAAVAADASDSEAIRASTASVLARRSLTKQRGAERRMDQV